MKTITILILFFITINCFSQFGYSYGYVPGLTDSLAKKVDKDYGIANYFHIYKYLHITQGSGASGITNIFQVFDSLGYNRLLVTDKGLIIFGSQHDSTINVDALFLGGKRCSVTKINSGTLGYNSFNNSDSSIVIGNFIDSTVTAGHDKITIGSGISSSQRLLNSTNNSVAIGANEVIPGIVVTSGKVTIQSILKSDPRSSAPSNPEEGWIYVNSTDHHIYCYLNGTWKQLDN